MTNPSRHWDRVPVFGSWQHFDRTPEKGQIRMTVSQRINRTDGRAIYPGGAAVTATIGYQSQQDAAVRAYVRAAWRAADEAAAGMGFDGAAWDEWWETVLVPSAIFASLPASDDPDITPQGYQVRVDEDLPSGKGRQYYIQPLLSHLDLAIPGINLGVVEVPPGSPTVPAPIYAKGQPGGVAPLNDAGKVSTEFLPAGADGVGVPVGGASGQVLAKATGDDFDTEWVNPSAGDGGTAGVSSVNGRSGAVTLAATDVGLGSVTNVSATQLRDRATHTGAQAISTVTGLQPALNGKADVGHAHAEYATTADLTDGLATKITGVAITQAAYDALPTPRPAQLYVIVPE